MTKTGFELQESLSHWKKQVKDIEKYQRDLFDRLSDGMISRHRYLELYDSSCYCASAAIFTRDMLIFNKKGGL